MTAFERELLEVLGEAAFAKLMGEKGGSLVHIPKVAENSALAHFLGMDAAQALIDFYGYGELVLPCGSQRGEGGRRERAKHLLRFGLSAKVVAEGADINVRTAYKYKAQLVEAGEIPSKPNMNASTGSTISQDMKK